MEFQTHALKPFCDWLRAQSSPEFHPDLGLFYNILTRVMLKLYICLIPLLIVGVVISMKVGVVFG